MNNDLKSSEALKAYARKVLCEDNVTNNSLLKMFDYIIDHAPSVELSEKAEDYTSIVCGECVLGDCDSCEDLRGDTE